MREPPVSRCQVALLHPSAARRLIDRYHHSGQPQNAAARSRRDQLTPREHDVLALLAQGETDADIATALDMRESTVKATSAASSLP